MGKQWLNKEGGLESHAWSLDVARSNLRISKHIWNRIGLLALTCLLQMLSAML